MIFEAIVELFMVLAGLISGALGSLPAPGWLEAISGQFETMAGYVAPVGVWIPWAAIGTVVTAVFACLGIAIVVRIVRVVVSLFTGGGGSAG